jgi:hypothetical protein
MTEVATEVSPEISAEISRFDAENATALVADFLKRLGYKGTWLPMKVSMDGELYVVEMSYQDQTTKVQINAKTKEIREYEFTGGGESKGLFKSKKIIFIIAGLAIGIVVLKLVLF